jgi:hypothetical protein
MKRRKKEKRRTKGRKSNLTSRAHVKVPQSNTAVLERMTLAFPATGVSPLTVVPLICCLSLFTLNPFFRGILLNLI